MQTKKIHRDYDVILQITTALASQVVYQAVVIIVAREIVALETLTADEFGLITVPTVSLAFVYHSEVGIEFQICVLNAEQVVSLEFDWIGQTLASAVVNSFSETLKIPRRRCHTFS